MTLQPLNPPELSPARTYSQVVIAQGTKTVYVSGQVALDAAGNLVGAGDLAAQARQAFRNLVAALAAAGATPASVAKMTWYIVNYAENVRPILIEARREAFGPHAPASTLIGVQALAEAGFLIEVEAIAVLD
ncbi:MAG TPA: RidA family protein [bacterium]|jgi:enamine deaminase RidA (YjgF/YER057c/UK114 family)|nr:RidA family protein [bacterium]